MTAAPRLAKLPPMLVPPLPFAAFLLLFAAASAALWRPTHTASLSLGMAALLAAVLAGLVDGRGVLWLLGAAACVAGVRAAGERRWLAHLSLVLLALWVLAAALHALPGFTPLTWQEHFGRDGTHTLRWHVDKGMAGLLLLLALPAGSKGDWRWRLPCLLGGTLLILLAALASGLASFEPAWLEGALLWLVGNLFLTVIAEEAFFRGLIQRQLCALGAAWWLALLASALLFALAHLAWGWPFAVLAGLAGLFYGSMFGRSQSLRWAVFAHGLVNACTLLLLHSPLG